MEIPEPVVRRGLSANGDMENFDKPVLHEKDSNKVLMAISLERMGLGKVMKKGEQALLKHLTANPNVQTNVARLAPSQPADRSALESLAWVPQEWKAGPANSPDMLAAAGLLLGMQGSLTGSIRAVRAS